MMRFGNAKFVPKPIGPTMEWTLLLQRWRQEFGVRVRKPLPADSVRRVLTQVECQHDELNAFYCVTNGMSSEWFEIFPMFDDRDKKHTWQNIVRVNDPAKTCFLQPELLPRFLIFAGISGGKVAVIDRTDGSVWNEDGDQLCQTILSLADFIETCLREVRDL